MNRRYLALSALALALALPSCGKSSSSGDNSSSAPAAQATTPAPATPESAAAAPAATSKYDSGPRASESAVDAGLAGKGKMLFTSKGCVACHGFGKVITCPDLVGVPKQRSAEW